MNHLAEYTGLFLASFAAATIFPFQSEVVLFGMLLTHHYSTAMLVVVASLGNILGSCANWGMGRLLAAFEDRPWFPVKRTKIARAERWYHHYGRWSLLLSWAPIVGDPSPSWAGAEGTVPIFLALVTIARSAVCRVAGSRRLV